MELKARQRWKYKHRPGESLSRIIICKIEKLHGNEVFHIRVDNLSTVPGLRLCSHLPICRSTLEASVTELVEEIPLDDMPDDWKPGYRDWKDAHGGVFELESVQELLTILEDSISGGGIRADDEEE